MTNNTDYFTKRAVCYKRGLDHINYGQTGVAKTDASSGEDHCWFVPDGALTNPSAIKMLTKFIYNEDVGYADGLKA